ncbi:hypothetical protein RMB03_20695 [Acinetobacter sp. V91_7]|uniref:hypothetical protein n=1 Tax=unclassified Acinetobacter TaxID=196816 RepID=UPI00287D92CA|nr:MULTISPECIES: hypothetical protein [unclassified Acinetobacter]MDS7933611.1 hypothetical protein [Acinetobacter sp. V91_4B]MDS7965367.1 hypothetical protein [Acinetobacter sp. V91_7]MDS8029196.1 hypothetical protein [Acinetobacter sp. V91_13]
MKLSHLAVETYNDPNSLKEVVGLSFIGSSDSFHFAVPHNDIQNIKVVDANGRFMLSYHGLNVSLDEQTAKALQEKINEVKSKS